MLFALLPASRCGHVPLGKVSNEHGNNSGQLWRAEGSFSLGVLLMLSIDFLLSPLENPPVAVIKNTPVGAVVGWGAAQKNACCRGLGLE